MGDVRAVMNMKPHLERRTTVRHACRVEAILHHGDERCHAMILDYTDTGLQIWVRDLLISGTDVQLSVGRVNLDGRVQWCHNKSAGIALSQPMDEALRLMLDRAKAANAPSAG